MKLSIVEKVSSLKYNGYLPMTYNVFAQVPYIYTVFCFQIVSIKKEEMSSSSDSESDMSVSDLSDSSSESESSSDNESSEDFDPRDSLLPALFQEKEPRLVLSKWALSKLRKLFLGKQVTKEERAAFMVSFCICSLFKLFMCFFRTNTTQTEKRSSCSNLKNLERHRWLLFASEDRQRRRTPALYTARFVF